MKITAHCLVKNEEKFIWYAVNSILEYVNEVIVWDTGSTDETVKIIRTISNSKINFAEKGKVDLWQFAKLRNEMIKTSAADWLFILDGDEIWYEEGIGEIINLIKKHGNSKDLIVSPAKMLVGDIFHFQEGGAGRYKIKDKIGHFNVRAIRNFKGLHVKGFFGNEGYVGGDNTDIQNRPDDRILFAKNFYLHASHLRRSSVSNPKYKYELGIHLPKDFYYPEVFFRLRPDIVPSPWKIIDLKYKLNAHWQTPLKKIKRRLI